MRDYFKLQENNTNVQTEIRAGMTTFFAMAYIIFLNPVFLSATGMNGQGVLIATCISAAIGSILCALFSNKPFAMASGMGLNTFFAYTICGTYGYSWQQALALTLLAGLLFLAVVASPIRDAIIRSVPVNLKHAITAGIGLFIALIGLLNAGLIKMTAGFPELGEIKSPAVLVALAGLTVTIILVVCNVKGNLFIGMLFTVILSVVTGQTAMPGQILSLPLEWKEVFLKLDFHGLVQTPGIKGIAALIALIISMTMVDLFDTLGFLIGADAGTGLLEKDGDLSGYKNVLISDAAATAVGALCGTSTVTCYAESSTGIMAGGRTGLVSLTTAVCFLLAIFFSPLAGVITAAATAPALLVVGMYLVMDIRNVDFSHMDDAIPAFMTIIVMTFSYSITTGIAAGFISYFICKTAAGKWKELNPTVLILTIVFFLHFLL